MLYCLRRSRRRSPAGDLRNLRGGNGSYLRQAFGAMPSASYFPPDHEAADIL
jgi:hypothetical protein